MVIKENIKINVELSLKINVENISFSEIITMRKLQKIIEIIKAKLLKLTPVYLPHSTIPSSPICRNKNPYKIKCQYTNIIYQSL